MARTWILTGSPENHAATREHGFSVIGLKERNRNRALEMVSRASSPEVVLEASEWVPAESMIEQLEHIRKWPREHWTLAFQGQIRPVSDDDASMLMDRLSAATGART